MHTNLSHNSAIVQKPGAAEALFTGGTLFHAQSGTISVEDITPGTRIITKDRGYQSIAQVTFTDIDLQNAPHLAPILFRADSLLFQKPDKQCYLAPSARVALCHPLFDMMFGQREVYAQADHLLEIPGVSRVEGLRGITYVTLSADLPFVALTNTLAISVADSPQRHGRRALSAREARIASQILVQRPINSQQTIHVLQ
ncbi:MAG: Hint domain-containing protein [Pseudomonadota bacterium]